MAKQKGRSGRGGHNIERGNSSIAYAEGQKIREATQRDVAAGIIPDTKLIPPVPDNRYRKTVADYYKGAGLTPRFLSQEEYDAHPRSHTFDYAAYTQEVQNIFSKYEQKAPQTQLRMLHTEVDFLIRYTANVVNRYILNPRNMPTEKYPGVRHAKNGRDMVFEHVRQYGENLINALHGIGADDMEVYRITQQVGDITGKMLSAAMQVADANEHVPPHERTKFGIDVEPAPAEVDTAEVATAPIAMPEPVVGSAHSPIVVETVEAPYMDSLRARLQQEAQRFPEQSEVFTRLSAVVDSMASLDASVLAGAMEHIEAAVDAIVDIIGLMTDRAREVTRQFAQKANIAGRLDEQTAALNQTQEDAAVIEQMYTEDTARVTDLERLQTELEQQLADAEQEVERLREEQEEATAHISDLEEMYLADMEDANDRIRELAEVNRGLKKRVQELQEQLRGESEDAADQEFAVDETYIRSEYDWAVQLSSRIEGVLDEAAQQMTHITDWLSDLQLAFDSARREAQGDELITGDGQVLQRLERLQHSYRTQYEELQGEIFRQNEELEALMVQITHYMNALDLVRNGRPKISLPAQTVRMEDLPDASRESSALLQRARSKTAQSETPARPALREEVAVEHTGDIISVEGTGYPVEFSESEEAEVRSIETELQQLVGRPEDEIEAWLAQRREAIQGRKSNSKSHAHLVQDIHDGVFLDNLKIAYAAFGALRVEDGSFPAYRTFTVINGAITAAKIFPDVSAAAEPYSKLKRAFGQSREFASFMFVRKGPTPYTAPHHLTALGKAATQVWTRDVIEQGVMSAEKLNAIFQRSVQKDAAGEARRLEEGDTPE